MLPLITQQSYTGFAIARSPLCRQLGTSEPAELVHKTRPETRVLQIIILARLWLLRSYNYYE